MKTAASDAESRVQRAPTGGTDLAMSRLVLGMMTFGDPTWRPFVRSEREAIEAVEIAAEAGVNAFDTADSYSFGVSERFTGRALARTFARRDEYVVATKVGKPSGSGAAEGGGLSAAHIAASIDGSLERLGCDHVDLYQIHGWDPHTSVVETLEALNSCVEEGKVRHLGASNLRSWQLAKYEEAAAVNGLRGFSSMQVHYNLLYREDERDLIPQCHDRGIAVLSWGALARGRLARDAPESSVTTVRAATDDRARELYDGSAADDASIVEAVREVASRLGVEPGAVALAWLFARGVRAPIIGVSDPAQIRGLVAGADLELDPGSVRLLERSYTVRPEYVP